MTEGWQHAVSKSGTLLLSQDGYSLEAAHTAVTVFLTYLVSMLSLVSNTVIFQCFDPLGVGVGAQLLMLLFKP